MLELNKIAADIYKAYQTKQPYQTAFGLSNYNEAFALQDLISNQLGKTLGYKVGYQNESNFVMAPLIDNTFFSNGASIKRQNYRLCLIECELAVEFKSTMPHRKQHYSEAEIIKNISSIKAGLEICDSRLIDYPKSDALWQLADQLSNGGYVLGTGMNFSGNVFDPQLMNKANFKFKVIDAKQNTRIFFSENKTHPFKNVMKLLVDFVNHICDQNKQINAGDIITTGSFCGSHEVFVGDTISASFENIGSVSAKVV